MDQERALAKKDEGNAKFKAKEYDAALELYAEAMAIDSSISAVILGNRCVVHSCKKDWESVVVDGKKSTALDPSRSVKPWIHLISAYVELDNFKEARAAFTAASDLFPDEASLKAVKARLDTKRESDLTLFKRLKENGMHAYKRKDLLTTQSDLSAISHITDGVAVEEYSEVMNVLARSYIQTGKHEKAAEVFAQLLDYTHERNPDPKKLCTISNNLGNCYKNMKSFENARRYLQEALQQARKAYGDKTNEIAIIADNLGQVLRISGEAEAAIECYDHALQIREQLYGPNHASLGLSYLYLARVHNHLKKYEQAITLYQKILTVWHGRKPAEILKELPEIPSDARFQILLSEVLQEYGSLQRGLKIEQAGHVCQHHKNAPALEACEEEDAPAIEEDA